MVPLFLTQLTGVDQLQRSFAISIRRGMLPWRFSAESTDLCAAEPYHPDRVARQFKLDQQVPYNPLQSLLAETDVGVAYDIIMVFQKLMHRLWGKDLGWSEHRA